MHILVDARQLNAKQQSGVGGYTTEILGALFSIDQKNQYTLLTSGRTRPTLPWKGPRITHEHIGVPNKALNLSLLSRKRPHLTAFVPDADLVFMPNLNITSLPEGIPLVLTVHDLSFELFPSYYSRRMRAWHRALNAPRLTKRATHIITPSETTAADTSRVFGIDRSRISVVPHGVTDQFAPRMRPEDHGVRSRLRLPSRFVLFLGTHEPRKNLPALIEAMHRYRERRGGDIRLVLAGAPGWNRRELNKMLRDTRYRSWIHELGYVASADKPALYRAAEALVWPSIYEGFGLPILEAMASGTPVITSHTSSLPEVAGDGAILVNPFDPTDLVQAFEQLLESPRLQSTLSERGIARAKGFSWGKTAEKTLEIFTQNS